MELYGEFKGEGSNFKIKRRASDEQTVLSVKGHITQFNFMDDKGLKSVIAFRDGRVEIIKTDDGTVLHIINRHGQEPIVNIEVLEHVKKRPRRSKLNKNIKDRKSIEKAAEKFLLPLEFNEATKSLKRKLKYLESLENPTFLFLIDAGGNLCIYLNSWFPVTYLPLSDFVGIETVLPKQLKVSKDLSKLFLLVETSVDQSFLCLDSRFLGYKSGIIEEVTRLIYESNEYFIFIKNKTEEWRTFLNNAQKKYNAELGIIERSCSKAPKHIKMSDKYNKEGVPKPCITEDIKMLAVHSFMTQGFRKYIETVAKERKELVKREENIQNELDKIENLVTNFIMTSIETVILRLSKLLSYSEQREKYEMIGLDANLTKEATKVFFKLYQKFEELNLTVIEAKLDIKNFYWFINKYAQKYEGVNQQVGENDNTYNPLNKYVVDYIRLVKFIENKKGEFRIERCKSLLENSKIINETLPDNKSLEDIVISNLSKVYDRKDINELDFSDDYDKVNRLIQEATEAFSKIYSLPQRCISKYYRAIQYTVLSSNQNSVVHDMFIKSKSLYESNVSSKLDDEQWHTIAQSHNLSDSDDIINDLLIAISYTVTMCDAQELRSSYHYKSTKSKKSMQASEVKIICVYYQAVPKKVEVEGISSNMALISLPSGYDLIKCEFHGKNKLMISLKAFNSHRNDKIAHVPVILENLSFHEIDLNKIDNNVEQHIMKNWGTMTMASIKVEPDRYQ